ncbi:unnamed protein product [Closterium sp. NIES-65]|nr:unnamed protein product [Closterium sp. NIES-65]
MALEAKAGSGAESGWISAGWSADGRMYPADCVIGNLPGGSMGAYYMSGYGDSDVAPTSSFALGSAEMLTSNGGTVMKFSRASGDGGAIPVDVAGVNTVIWAYSQSGSTALGFHGRNDGATSVDFSCVGATAAANSTAGSGAGGSNGSNATTGGGSGGSSGSTNSTTGSGTGSSGSGSTTNSTTPAPPSTPPAYNESFPFPPDSNGFVSPPPHHDGDHDHGIEHGNDGEQEGGDWGDREEWAQWGNGEGEREEGRGDGGEGDEEGEGGEGGEGGDGAGGGDVAGWGALDFHNRNDGSVQVDFTCATAAAGNSTSASTQGDDSQSLGATSAAASSSGSSSSSACKESSLTGYDCMVQLSGDNFILHWKATTSATSTIALAAEAATSGWVSLGWSASGRMYPAEAAIGNPPPYFPLFPSPHPCSFILHWKTSATNTIAVAAEAATSGFILHWKATTSATSTIAVAAEAATSGWVSVGWSASGRMYPAEAAIGNLPAGTLSTGNAAAAAVGAYSMSGYGASDVTVTSSFAVTNTAVEAGNGRTVVKFERPMTDGEFPVSSSRVLWAYSRDNSQQLADHGPNAGSATVNFATGASEVGGSSTESATLYTVHAWLLTVAFGMLMPAAILVSRLFLADKPMPGHSTAPAAASNPGASNSGTAAAGTAAAGGLGEPMLGEKHGGAAAAKEGGGSPLKASLPSSLVAEDAPALVALSVGGPSPAAAAGGAAGSGTAGGAAATRGGAVARKPWVSKPMAFEVHKWLMLSAVLLALAGIIMAFVEKGSQSLQSTHGQLGLAVMVLIVVQPIVGQLRPLKKHPSRPSWFALHWVVGVGTVVIAWANTYLGFKLATSKFGYDLNWSYIAFSILIGLFSAVYVFDFVAIPVQYSAPHPAPHLESCPACPFLAFTAPNGLLRPGRRPSLALL